MLGNGMIFILTIVLEKNDYVEVYSESEQQNE